MFRYFVLGYLSTLLLVYHTASRPWQEAIYSGWSLFALLLGGGLVTLTRFRPEFRFNRIIIQVLFGGLIAFLLSFCVESLSAKLPQTVWNQKVWVEGEIVGLPTEKPSRFGGRKIQFTLKLFKLNHHAATPAWQIFAPKIRIAWYQQARQAPRPKSGERWRFLIKLKPNHYSLNPGGFDYETYLFQQHIQGHGYVLKTRSKGYAETAKRMQVDSNISLQQTVRDQLQPWFKQSAFSGIFSALLYGDKSGISQTQWELLRQTGTLHLMAISGLHIGILAAIGFGLFGWLWRWSVLYCPVESCRQRVAWVPKVFWASVGATLFAVFYMALAGFAIPTVRAGLMVLLVLIFLFMRRRFQVWTALAWVAFAIVLLDSRAVLSQGFWLSFTAVAIIYHVIATDGFANRKAWQQILMLQLALTLGMSPILAGFYGQIPWVGLVANLIAVPAVTLIGLPLLMLTAVLILLFGSFLPAIAQDLILLNSWLWQLLWSALQAIDDISPAVIGHFWHSGHLSLISILLVYGVLALWLNLKRIPTVWRWRGAGLGIVLFFVIVGAWHTSNNDLLLGQVRMTVLDVGQGQAMVFETAHHTLVYDTGPKYSQSLDGASMAILPYLSVEKRNHLDKLIVSHSDTDHSGGTETLLENSPVKSLLSGQPEILNQRLKTNSFSPCTVGQHWQYDQVNFEILSPERNARYSDDNDTSCVLKVSTGSQSILVMGDASKQIEQKLIQTFKQNPDQLKATLLVAGHHGSQTATSSAWIAAVKPKWAIFSAGYLNRYHFPNRQVVQRLQNAGVYLINTACSGAIQVKMTSKQLRIENRQRIDMKTWYHHQCGQASLAVNSTDVRSN